MSGEQRMAMTDDDPNLSEQSAEDTLAPEVEQEARDTGWSPKEEFHGNPEHWVDAQTWVEKGRTLSPLIKAQNRGLKEDLERERQERLRLEHELLAQRAALKAIEDTQFEATVVDVKAEKQRIKAEIAEASRNGEHERVADLTEQLIELKEPEKPVVKTNGEAGSPAVDPHFTAWYAKNDWYGKDHRRSGLAEGIGKELALRGIKGAEFYRELDKELSRELREQRRGNGVDRQEGAHHREDGFGTKKGYHDLPAEARRACDDYASKLVGPRKKYQKIEEWRAAYATKYFEGE